MNTSKNISSSKAVFWHYGNNPTQIIGGLTFNRVNQEFAALFLLSEKILAAASFYLESSITRDVTLNNLPLFDSGDAQYFLDDDLKNVTDHASKKISKNPLGTRYQSDKQGVIRLAKELDTFDISTKIPKISISDRMVNLWAKDLRDTAPGTLGNFLTSQIPHSSDLLKLSNFLIFLAENRCNDFVWEYVHPEIKKRFQLSDTVFSFIRKRLAEIYCEATCQLIEAQPDHNITRGDSDVICVASKYEPNLFLECARVLGIERHLLSLSSEQLIHLKRSPEFGYFKDFYFSFIDAVAYDQHQIEKCLQLLNNAETAFASYKVSRDRFLLGFYLTAKEIVVIPNLIKPLDKILKVYEYFGSTTITRFVSSIRLLTEQPQSPIPISQQSDQLPAKIENIYDASFYLADMHHTQQDLLLKGVLECLQIIVTKIDRIDLADQAAVLEQAKRVFSSPDINSKDKLTFTLKLPFVPLKYEKELSVELKGKLSAVIDKVATFFRIGRD